MANQSSYSSSERWGIFKGFRLINVHGVVVSSIDSCSGVARGGDLIPLVVGVEERNRDGLRHGYTLVILEAMVIFSQVDTDFAPLS